MKKYLILALVIGVLLIPLLFIDKKDPYLIANYPPQNDVIIAFGDSLVEGVGASRNNDFVSVLGSLLGKNISNFGKSGDTTRSALPRLVTVLEKQPGVVIVLLGGNDYIKKIPQEETENNLKIIVSELQAQGSVVVLLGVRGGLLKDQRGDMYKNISEELGAVYVEDVLDGIFAQPDLMSDAIHPNDKGYAMIAEKVFKEMKFLYE